jgi:hypothetical protein
MLHLAIASCVAVSTTTIVPIAGPLLWSGIQAGRTAEFI